MLFAIVNLTFCPESRCKCWVKSGASENRTPDPKCTLAWPRSKPWQASELLCKYLDQLLSTFGTAHLADWNQGQGTEQLLQRWLNKELVHTQTEAEGGVFKVHEDKHEDGAGGTRLKGVPRAQAQQARVRAAQKLLAMCPSAIHLKLVQRTLVRQRQDLLTPFLGGDDPFQGLFYDPYYGWNDRNGTHQPPPLPPFELKCSRGMQRLLPADARRFAAGFLRQVQDTTNSPSVRKDAITRWCNLPCVDFTQTAQEVEMLRQAQLVATACMKEAQDDEKEAKESLEAAQAADEHEEVLKQKTLLHDAMKRKREARPARASLLTLSPVSPGTFTFSSSVPPVSRATARTHMMSCSVHLACCCPRT